MRNFFVTGEYDENHASENMSTLSYTKFYTISVGYVLSLFSYKILPSGKVKAIDQYGGAISQPNIFTV